MGRILQAILLLLLLGALAVIGYAYFGDMTPAATEQRLEITLPSQPPAPAPATGTPQTGGAVGN
ncbi:MAG: hypothetical protein AB7U46_17540 [Paenirhodobacter sp.]